MIVRKYPKPPTMSLAFDRAKRPVSYNLFMIKQPISAKFLFLGKNKTNYNTIAIQVNKKSKTFKNKIVRTVNNKLGYSYIPQETKNVLYYFDN